MRRSWNETSHFHLKATRGPCKSPYLRKKANKRFPGFNAWNKHVSSCNVRIQETSQQKTKQSEFLRVDMLREPHVFYTLSKWVFHRTICTNYFFHFRFCRLSTFFSTALLCQSYLRYVLALNLPRARESERGERSTHGRHVSRIKQTSRFSEIKRDTRLSVSTRARVPTRTSKPLSRSFMPVRTAE